MVGLSIFAPRERSQRVRMKLILSIQSRFILFMCTSSAMPTWQWRIQQLDGLGQFLTHSFWVPHTRPVSPSCSSTTSHNRISIPSYRFIPVHMWFEGKLVVSPLTSTLALGAVSHLFLSVSISNLFYFRYSVFCRADTIYCSAVGWYSGTNTNTLFFTSSEQGKWCDRWSAPNRPPNLNLIDVLWDE